MAVATAKNQVRCPFCTRMADPEKVPGEGDIICVQCGLNLLTGQQIQQTGLTTRGDDPPRRGRRWVWLFALAPALLVLAGLAALAYVLLKDPVQEATELAAKGNTLEAQHLLDEYISTAPEDSRARMLRGKLLWTAQDYERAAQDFEAVLSREPRHEDAAQLAMLSVSKLQGGQAAARQMALYQKVLEAQPENATAQRMLALAHGAAGNYAGQAASIERLKAQGVDDSFMEQMRGAALALQGRRSEAELAFTEAARSGDTGGMAQLAQGLLASMNEDEARARQALDQAARAADPDVAQLAAARLGLLHMAAGEYEKALPLLRRATESGVSEEARYFHALCLRQLRLNAEAHTALLAVRDGNSKYAPDAAMELALMALEANDPDAAEQHLRAAGDKGRESARMQTVQGRIYLARGQHAEAQQNFRLAVNTDPAYAPAHLENGLLYITRGLTAEGIRELQEYLELAGDTVSGGVPEVRLLLSQLQETNAAPGQEAAP
jgi:protein O-GlcNAc transferase